MVPSHIPAIVIGSYINESDNRMSFLQYSFIADAVKMAKWYICNTLISIFLYRTMNDLMQV